MLNSGTSAEQKNTNSSASGQGADKILNFAQQNNTANFHRYCHIADGLHKRGKYEEAKSAWNQALALDPNNVDVRIEFGVALAETGEIEKALEQFSQAVALDPDNIDANYLLGMAHFQLEHFEQALKCWKYCLANKSGLLQDTDSLYMCLAEAYRALGKPHKAIYQLNHILENNPADIDAYNLLGMLFFEIGERALSIDALKRAVACNPDFYRSHLNLGVVYFGCGIIDFAIHEFNKACQCNPRDTDAFYNLGRSLALKGDIQGACQALKKSLELSPDQSDSLDLLSNLEIINGEFGAARAHLKRLLEIIPDNISTLCDLAEVEHSQYNYQEAEGYLLQALKLDSHNPIVHYSLALLYRDQNKKLPQAADHMRKAIELQQNNPEYQLIYGDILAESNKENKAKDAWEKAIELDPALADDIRSRLKKLNRSNN
ncbi:MAG: tetratricopeptide repeat protein [Candidatus Bruticola sp.]